MVWLHSITVGLDGWFEMIVVIEFLFVFVAVFTITFIAFVFGVLALIHVVCSVFSEANKEWREEQNS